MFFLTFYFYLELLNTELGNKKQQIQALQLLSIMLPVAHRDLAAVMLKFMALLSNNKEVNKMTPDNLAVCLGPALFRDSRYSISFPFFLSFFYLLIIS